MLKFILTVIVGFVFGKVFLWALSYSPNAVYDYESVVALYFIGPLIALATVYGPVIYRTIFEFEE